MGGPVWSLGEEVWKDSTADGGQGDEQEWWEVKVLRRRPANSRKFELWLFYRLNFYFTDFILQIAIFILQILFLFYRFFFCSFYFTDFILLYRFHFLFYRLYFTRFSFLILQISLLLLQILFLFYRFIFYFTDFILQILILLYRFYFYFTDFILQFLFYIFYFSFTLQILFSVLQILFHRFIFNFSFYFKDYNWHWAVLQWIFSNNNKIRKKSVVFSSFNFCWLKASLQIKMV